jgi:biopolymer transport protein ExbD
MRQFARNHPRGEAKAKEEVTVIIRADRDARFSHIHKTMLAIKSAGFKKLQFRALLDQAK